MRHPWLLLLCATVVLSSSPEASGDALTSDSPVFSVRNTALLQEKATVSAGGEPAVEEETQEKKDVSEAEAEAYERVAQVAKKLSSVEQGAAAEQLKANNLMDDELHHLNTIGSLTLAQRKNAKEIENKRYDGVHEERVEADKTEQAQRAEIQDLKAELSKVVTAHEIAHKASEKADKIAKVKYMNERSHKVNLKEGQTKTKKESNAKSDAKQKGEKALMENEKRERNFKVGREKELVAEHTRQRDQMNTYHSKAKADAKIAVSTVENLANHIKTLRNRDRYMDYVNKYKAAVTVEHQKLEDLSLVEARKKRQEAAMTEEKGKFESLKKKQKQAAATAKENHEKAVSGRESRNCHKMCKLYRVATDSTSNAERAKTVKKNMCFAEPKEEESTEVAEQVAAQKADTEEKNANEAEQQQQKNEERGEENDANKAASPDPATTLELLGESEDPNCVGMQCTCISYTSYEGSDDMDSIDNSGVVNKRR